MKIKTKMFFVLLLTITILSAILLSTKKDGIQTSANIDNEKIGWGIKRNDNHEQPDCGTKNRKILEENNGICLGNKDKKNIYLTFDEGYEAGYTPKILEILRNNNVKATFFITAHYVNTETDLVQQMINEGHIVGNQSPHTLMEL